MKILSHRRKMQRYPSASPAVCDRILKGSRGTACPRTICLQNSPSGLELFYENRFTSERY